MLVHCRYLAVIITIIKAADIANAVARIYIQHSLDKKSESAESILKFIDDQLSYEYDKIKILELSLDSFPNHNTEINGNNALQQVALTQNMSRLVNLQDQDAMLDIDEDLLSRVKERLASEENINPTELLILLSGNEFGGQLTTNLTELQQLLQKKRDASFDLKPQSPDLVNDDKQIDDQKKVILQSFPVINQKILDKKADLQKMIDELKANMPEQG